MKCGWFCKGNDKNRNNEIGMIGGGEIKKEYVNKL